MRKTIKGITASTFTLGIVIEHGIETLETNPGLIWETYIQSDYSNDESIEFGDIYGWMPIIY
jgi:hypothetical protein